jgi:phosphatidyl-myo-inositol dimannoside synthase
MSDLPVTLLLTSDFPPQEGGVARWTGELARRYPADRIVVSTGAVPGAEASDAALDRPVERLPIPVGRLRTWPAVLRWTRAARRLAADRRVAFVWCDTVRPAGYVGRALAERPGIPYGILVHGDDLVALAAKASRSVWKRWVARRLLGGASIVVANSGWTADRARAVLGALGLEAARDRVHRVPLGSDPSRFRPDAATDAVLRRYDLSAGPRLLTVARLVPYKGVDTGIRALARLAVDWPELHYLVAGAGPDRARLDGLAAELGVAGRVRFLGRVPDADLPALHAAADVYLGLSRSSGVEIEGFGISLADAAASGVAVVAGRGGGTADAVEEGVTGLLVDPERSDEVAQALGGLLRDPGRRRALGAAGRRRVETDLNWERVIRDLQALSRRALATPVRSRSPGPGTTA